MKLRSIVVDDEPLARSGLRSYLEQIPLVEVVGEAGDTDQLSEILERESVDLIFLDIEMPGLSGIDFVKKYEGDLPLFIYVTAYHDFAVESYELHAVDYLLKPVSPDRLTAAVQKAQEVYRFRAGAIGTDDPFFVKHEGKYEKVDPGEILCVSSMQNYVKLHVKGGEMLIIRSTLKEFQQQLGADNFLMVHKSYVVNTDHVRSVSSSGIEINELGQIPLGRTHKDKVLDIILKR